MNYLLLIKTAAEAAKTIEALMPESKGKEKREASIAMVEAVVGSVEGMLPALVLLFTTLVNGFRDAGVFKKKPTTTPPAA